MGFRAEDIIFQRIRASASQTADTTVHTDSVDVSDTDRVLYYLDVGTTGASGTLDVSLETGSESKVLDNLSVSKDTDIELDRTTNTEVGFSFTTPDNAGVRVTKVNVWAYREGTIAASKQITCTLQAGAAEPDDTDLFTPVNAHVECADIATSANGGTVLEFDITTPEDLAADTVYWVVLEGTYDASTSNCVHFYVDTVASGGNAMIHTTDWQAAVTTQTGAVEVIGTDFTLMDADFVQVTPSNDNTYYVMQVPTTQNDQGARQRLKGVTVTEATVWGMTAIKETKTRPGSQTNAAVVVTALAPPA